jgi:hypothetical protein
VSSGRKALVVATYRYADSGLSQLAAPEHDAEAFASVLQDPEIAGFDVTTLVNQPHHVVGEAIADFYGDCRRDDLTLLYFSGHGLKDDEGRLHLAMTNTRRQALMFTAISAAQLNEAMDACPSRRKVLILDCCYSGAFPAGRTAKSDEGVQTLERFQGKGRAVLTASDATQYAFEGDDLSGSSTSSVFTRYLVEAIRSGEADLDEDGDIALDELYSYVRERVVAEVPQQRPKKQEDVDGRILIARNVHWTLPAHLRHAIDSPISAQRLSAVEGLAHLHRVGNDLVRATVADHVAALAEDDSRSVSSAATALLERLDQPVPPPARTPDVEVAVAVPAPRAGEPVQTVERPTVGVEAPPTPPVARTEELPVRLLLSLIVVAGALQGLSRFLVFDATSGYRAYDVDLAAAPWVLAVVVPLLVAALLLATAAREPWAVALAGGLVTGAALSQLDQVLATAGRMLQPDPSVSPGPGWFAALLGTVALLACVVVLARAALFRSRTGPMRTWLASVMTLVVLAAVVAKLVEFRWAYPWFAQNEPAILLALACLPLTLLALGPAQRVLGLTAVTVFGPWVCAAHVYEFANDDFAVDERAATVAIVSALASVAACYVAQFGSRRRPERPASGGRDAGPGHG